VEERRAESLASARQELKAGFENAQVVRLMVLADPSAMTVLQQYPRLLEARASLQKAQRERFVMLKVKDAALAIQSMLDELSTLLEEFRLNYSYLRLEGLKEEARMDRVRDGTADYLTLTDVLASGRFPLLKQWLHSAEYGGSELWDGYAASKAWLTPQGVSPSTVT
jgi:hypothetical protein